MTLAIQVAICVGLAAAGFISARIADHLERDVDPPRIGASRAAGIASIFCALAALSLVVEIVAAEIVL